MGSPQSSGGGSIVIWGQMTIRRPPRVGRDASARDRTKSRCRRRLKLFFFFFFCVCAPRGGRALTIDRQLNIERSSSRPSSSSSSAEEKKGTEGRAGLIECQPHIHPRYERPAVGYAALHIESHQSATPSSAIIALMTQCCRY